MKLPFYPPCEVKYELQNRVSIEWRRGGFYNCSGKNMNEISFNKS